MGNSVEVKSEPLSMIGGPPGHHDEVINYLMINTLIH